MSIIRTIMVVIFTISALYSLFATCSSIRAMRPNGFFHYYRLLYMPTVGLVVSSAAALVCAPPQLLRASAVAMLVGLVIGSRELVWAIRSAAKIAAAARVLEAERRRSKERR